MSADDKDKEKMWNGLADILIELKRHPFPEVGSLMPGSEPSKPRVSAIASERFLALSPAGPFNTAGDYYASFIEQNLALISDDQLFTSFPVNAYLVFLYLRTQIQDLVANASVEQKSFYLKHVDDKGDHLLVDDELNTTGIIDWQMARAVPADEAFGPSLVTADMGDLYDGLSSLTVHDHALSRSLRAQGADDLANTMSQDENLRLFFFGLDVDFSWDDTLLLVRGIWAAFGAKDINWETWKADMLVEYASDERLRQIIERFGAGP